MDTKHFFISALDINEILPFVVKEGKKLSESLVNHDKAKEELNKFVDILEKTFGESIFYLGMDVIGKKSYERFMFKKSGFLEFMVEAPIALNAHFPSKMRANKFCDALKKTLKKSLPKGTPREMFVDSIEVQNENDTSLKIEEWHKIKEIRG